MPRLLDMGLEDQYDDFFMPQPTWYVVGALLNPIVERLHALEEKFKSLVVHNTPDLDVVDMCLMPSLVISRKFKVLDFDKYNGSAAIELTSELIVVRWKPTSIMINS